VWGRGKQPERLGGGDREWMRGWENPKMWIIYIHTCGFYLLDLWSGFDYWQLVHKMVCINKYPLGIEWRSDLHPSDFLPAGMRAFCACCHLEACATMVQMESKYIIIKNTLKYQTRAHNYEEFINMNEMDFWFTRFGVRMQKLCFPEDCDSVEHRREVGRP
jgi:hypothetical protein